MKEIKPNGCDTHLVVKYTDIEKYLSKSDISKLSEFLSKIEDGRRSDGKTPVNNYYICNKDEPYANSVEKAILDGERYKTCCDLTDESVKYFIDGFMKLHNWGADPYLESMYNHLIQLIMYYVLNVDTEALYDEVDKKFAIIKLTALSREELLSRFEAVIQSTDNDEMLAHFNAIRTMEPTHFTFAMHDVYVYTQSVLSCE